MRSPQIYLPGGLSLANNAYFGNSHYHTLRGMANQLDAQPVQRLRVVHQVG
jgi:hypothetical protein